MSYHADAYAKINLTLDVTGKREDGYHLLRMVMQSVSLCDRITLEDSDEIRVSCNQPGLSLGEDNTISRAVHAFFEEANLAGAGADFIVEKRIPWQAGLGGGSADAAAALKLLNQKFRTGFSPERLRVIGLRVGADVPFCLTGGTVLAEGVGERITSLPPLPDCFLVICKPSGGNDTARAYSQLDSVGGIGTDFTGPVLQALEAKNLSRIASQVGNAFEEAVLSEDGKEIKRIMCGSGALGSCLSGSGSAVYGIFDNEKKASSCVSRLSSAFPQVFLCRPVNFQ